MNNKVAALKEILPNDIPLREALGSCLNCLTGTQPTIDVTKAGPIKVTKAATRTDILNELLRTFLISLSIYCSQKLVVTNTAMVNNPMPKKAPVALSNQITALGSTIPYQANIGLSFNAPVIGKMRLPLSKTGNL
ncbi:hypothetical protein TI05_07085, partial [Achromatium sp. WMS3]